MVTTGSKASRQRPSRAGTGRRKAAAPPIDRQARLARRMLWLIPTTILGTLLIVRLVVTSDYVSERVAERVAETIADRTRASVQLSGLTFGWNFAPCLQDLTLYRNDGPFEVRVVTASACVQRWGSALGSGFRAVRLRLESPSVEVIGHRQDAARAPKVAAKPKTAGAQGRAGALREIEVVFDGLQLRWEALPLPKRFAEGTFGPIDAGVTVQVRGRQSAAIIALKDPTTGARVDARASPTEQGWNLSAGLEGDLAPLIGDLVRSSLLDVQRLPIRGRAGVNYNPSRRTITVDLDLEENDAAVESEAVAKGTVAGFAARQRARIDVDLKARTLRVEEGLIEINRTPVVFSVQLEPGESSPAFKVKADLRTTPFVRLLKSVPGGETLGVVRRVSPNLNFALSLSVAGELRNPKTWAPELDFRFQSIDPNKAFTGLEFTRGPFEYFPLGPEGRRETAEIVGPSTDSWISYRAIPYVQRRAIIVSEDASFPFHKGLDIEELRAALQDAMAGHARPRGGSTISQQLVKNLFLSRDRAAQRKALELLLTFHLESWLSKEDIFALYANVIEWGPDLYGLKKASRHYFGRDPRALNPLEMAYLASIIPSPVRLHEHHVRGVVPKRHMRKVMSLLERLNRLGQLSDQALFEAKVSRLRFTRSHTKAPPKKETP